MGYNAPPPTQETIERAHEWNSKLCDAVTSLPIEGDWRHAELRDESIDWDTYPTWGFELDHHTLPSRQLMAFFGIPMHSPNCKCLDAPGVKLSIYIIDTDTHEEVPGAANLHLNDVEHIETVLSALGTMAMLFDRAGVI